MQHASLKPLMSTLYPSDDFEPQVVHVKQESDETVPPSSSRPRLEVREEFRKLQQQQQPSFDEVSYQTPAYPVFPSFPDGYPAAALDRPYGAFRGQRSYEPRNNAHPRQTGHSSSAEKQQQRKWNSGALRALQPPSPWPSWYFRPESPFGSSYGNHPFNCNNDIEFPPLARPQLDFKRFESISERVNKVHGHMPTICTSIRCTVNGCTCESFTPGERHLRCCENCHHGWVPHALARLSRNCGGDVASPVGRETVGGGGETTAAAAAAATSLGGDEQRRRQSRQKEERPPASETLEPTAAFDVASLVLYGARALPIRLKILLDQLLRQLDPDQLARLLAAFGWTHDDYARGYILQDSQNGPVLDRWSICSAEEEPLVLQQFLRFAETRPFVQQLLLAAGGGGATGGSTTTAPSSSSANQQHHHYSAPSPTDVMSPSRRPSPPTMPLAHLPPPLHLLHCGLPPPGASRLPHPLPPPPPQQLSPQPPTSQPQQQKGASYRASSPPRSPLDSSFGSPLNRLQSMQPFDFRKLGTLGLPAFPPIPPPPAPPSSKSSSASARLPSPVPPVAPVSSSSLAAFGHHPLVSSALPPSFHGHYPPSIMSKAAMMMPGASVDVPPTNHHDKSSEFGSDSDPDHDDENSGSALNLSRRDSGSSASNKHHNHSSPATSSAESHNRHTSSSASMSSLQQHGSLGRPAGVPGRKPNSPGKRQQWGASPNIPPNLGTPFINPATGKKRVQCNVCLKTFCDKGALKIHFSAVHLREMHQCTVKGCSMMFSSRRSRNRHSANPNPKLHSPHLRRKISPHDGRSSMAHALVLPSQGGPGLPLPPSGLNHLPFGSFPLLTPPPDLRSPASLCALDFKHLDLATTQNSARSYEEALAHQQRLATSTAGHITTASLPASTSSATLPTRTSSGSNASVVSPMSQNRDDDDDDDDDDGGIVVVGDDDGYLPTQLSSLRGDVDEPADFSLAKRPKLQLSDHEDVMSNADSNEDNDSIGQPASFAMNAHSLSSAFHSRGVRKRKSQHPTRCAMPTEVHSSSTDGDSSNDAVFQDQPEDMSMSRLEAADKRKKSPSPLVNEQNDCDSRSPDNSTHKDREPQEPEIKEEVAAAASQDEPADLSSRASSAKSVPSPEPKQQNEVEQETRKRKDSSGDEAEATTTTARSNSAEASASEERRSPPAAADSQRREESPARSQEGEPTGPTGCTAERLHDPLLPLPTLDSSNALRQLESLSQGRSSITTTTTTSDVAAAIRHTEESEPATSRCGPRSTSPASSTSSSISLHSSSPDNCSRGSRSSSASPSTAAMDTDSSHLLTYARYENGVGFVGQQEVPLDRENPRRCTACGKLFQNHFGVKTHYQNVHLKLMHRCSVEGCNAAFPSKRSRDRHSANLNLHRKLLSTSPTPPPLQLSEQHDRTPPPIPPPPPPPQLNPMLAHSEFLARLYADAGIYGPMELAARIPPPHPLLLPGAFPAAFASHLAGFNGLGTHPSLLRAESPMSSGDDKEQQLYEAAAKCTVPGCDRVFASRAVRDAHARDPQAHRELAS